MVDFDRLIAFVDAQLFEHAQRHLRDAEVFVLKGAWANQTYEKIAEIHSYTSQYLQSDVGFKLWRELTEVFGEKISKTNFKTILERHYSNFIEQAQGDPTLQGPPSPSIPIETHSDAATAFLNAELPMVPNRNWGEAIDVSVFYGRQEELVTLRQWVVQDHCRLLALLGMGGIGKTTLAVKLADLLEDEFECILWRSLRNVPTIEETLAEWIQSLPHPEEVPALDTLDNKANFLVNYLRQHRCLLFLDNFESILQSGTSTGSYNPGYEGYGLVLRYIAENPHQSCVILTGREKPSGFAPREGPFLPVRSLQLKGLKIGEVQSLFADKGCEGIQDEQTQALVEHYGGNPLALKIVAAALYEIGGGNVNELLPYLNQTIFRFDDINNLLARHFNRLSAAERQVMYWLAINRDPVAWSQLDTDIVPGTLDQSLLATFQSLSRRSLIERENQQWFLQPAILEYVTQRLVSGVCAEILGGEWAMLQRYALIKAQSLDYIREAQRRFIVQPVLNHLQVEWGSTQATIDQLRSRLQTFKEKTPAQPGYVAGNILNLLRELNVDLAGLDCSGLTIWQADFRQISLQGTNFSHCDVSNSVFTAVLNATISVAFSPDGNFFALGNTDNQVRIWQVAGFKELLTRQGHDSWVHTVAFSPDGEYLASGSFDHTIRLWLVQTGDCIAVLRGHKGWVRSVAFSQDGQTLASGSDDCTVKVWDIPTGTCRKTLIGHQDVVEAVAFSPNGQYLATAGNDCSIRLWEADTGTFIRAFTGHRNWVYTIAFSTDSQQIISGSNDCTVRIWDIQTGQCLQNLQGHHQAVRSVVYSPALPETEISALPQAIAGAIIVSGSQDCTVRIWEAATGKCLKVLKGHAERVWSVALHPSEQMLLSGSTDSTLKLWNPRTGQSLRTVQTSCAGLKSIVFSPNGALIASGGDDKTIRIWDEASGKCIQKMQGHSGWIWDLAFSPDGQMLASASGDRTVQLWDMNSGQSCQSLIGHLDIVFSVAIDPTGKWVATGSNDQTFKLWDVQRGTCIRSWENQGIIWSLAFNPQGSYLATSGGYQGVSLWDISTGNCLQVLRSAEAMVHSIAFSPDGQWLASGREDCLVEVWDWQRNHCAHRFNHQSRVWSVAFSSDGEYLASGGFDHTVKIWQVSTGQCLHMLQLHEGEVWSVVFHPQQSWLASSSQDGQVILWDTINGRPFNTLRETRLYEQLDITQTKGLSAAQKQSLQKLGAVYEAS